MKPIGLYVHIPFCVSKCSYCDFYSLASDHTKHKEYVGAVCENIRLNGHRFKTVADTLYIGGGTPTVLDAEDLVKIVNQSQESFILEGAEITVEANPADDLADTFNYLRRAGVNRLSLGVQSAVERELRILSRRHTFEQVTSTVKSAAAAGFRNISVDIMLGVPDQTLSSVAETVDKVLKLNPTHISAYMLKLEENTPLYRNSQSFKFPDDNETAEMYLYVCARLKKEGYEHYEISNFARPGFHSRHNLKYWNCQEYIGIGPAAHSFINGRRYYYNRDIDEFIRNPILQDDGEGGSFEEYVMLQLRLSEGVKFSTLTERFGTECTQRVMKNAAALKESGLLKSDMDRVSLTQEGFLLSNSVILQLLK